MSDLHSGKLRRVGKSKQLVLDHPTKPNAAPLPVTAGKLSTDLDPNKIDGLAVEFELVKGQIEHVREKGKPWQGAPPPSAPRGPRDRQQSGARGGGHAGGSPRRDQRPTPHDSSVKREFHNPYNFIPAPPRNVEDADLGDGDGAGHHVYHPERWTGALTVRLTTATPLLLADAARAWIGEKEHKTYPTRLAADGSPHIAPTGVKGMLRSAYEAVTNSRFGVLESHNRRLAYRQAVEAGLSVVPARVEIGPNGTLVLRLLPGSSEIGAAGRPTGPMYAAWLRMYPPHTKRWPLAQHEARVWAWITPWAHERFRFWNVVEMRDGHGPRPDDVVAEDRRPWRNARPDAGSGRWVLGQLCITKQNMDRKHDERVFFVTDGHAQSAHLCLPLSPADRAAWSALIADYQQEHREEIRRNARGPTASNAEWSRHVLGGDEERELREGTLCYARVEADPRGGFSLRGLYPVSISRDLYRRAPAELVADALKPSSGRATLSPADRVFGWVNRGGTGAYRGNLRIGPVRWAPSDTVASAADAIDTFEDRGVPLNILGQPKPQQARFYAAATQGGQPMASGLDKSKGYSSTEQGLRGRKVYPHRRRLPAGYWDDPATDRTQIAAAGRFQEYRRPHEPILEAVPGKRDKQAKPNADGTFCLDETKEQRDSQNRSITSWVKPGVAFTFSLHVTNLSDVELGALLWLLTLEEAHYFRLGGGKPLGFGSVRLELDRVALHRGTAWKEYYRSLSAAEPPAQSGDSLTAPDRAALLTVIDRFRAAVARAYGNGKPFDEVPFVRAFLRAATGFADDLPTHYPRTTRAPHPEGRNYEWFVQNESKDGSKLALPALDGPDPGLPLKPTRT